MSVSKSREQPKAAIRRDAFLIYRNRCRYGYRYDCIGVCVSISISITSTSMDVDVDTYISLF